MSDRYQFKEQIGKGGLGIVYRGYDTHLNREVAIKRVRIECGEPVEELTANLLEEARTLSALNNPYIVTVHDVGHDEEGPFVVMELLNGETLEQVIEKSVLPIPEFELLVNDTLEGLVGAQSVDLLHRDLKPANIMLSWLPSGKFQVKILDFGLAKFSPKPSTQTVDHGDSILGSIYFMAPEQFERKPLDFRTDLYSLGAIYYYCLTGHYPFDGDNAVAVMMSHINHDVRPLTEVRPDVPSYLWQWIEGLMARRMEERPANAGEAQTNWAMRRAIDEKQLKSAAGGSSSLAHQLLSEFAEETEELLDKMRANLEGGKTVKAAETARTIRGTASTLGYLGVIEITKEIEEKAETDRQACLNLIEKFPSTITNLENALGGISWSS